MKTPPTGKGLTTQTTSPKPKKQYSKALEEFHLAQQFTRSTHLPDLEWIKCRDLSTLEFDEFMQEYCYVVVASGFRARVASRLAPELAACHGDIEKMRAIFKNERKISSISKMYHMFHDKPDAWTVQKSTWLSSDVSALEALPFIGKITKFHLARNIGLSLHDASAVKPDLHLVRWCTKHGYGVKELVMNISADVCIPPGIVDFILWVWLSHEGKVKEGCCHGGMRLR
ncbi:hypothetical protein ADUPG1_007804 [Aduncisulcus paluster]|uniref:Uncharacterized protein n=1 Tax=Aduncisulcus paluster TaxID=2918883 RepID=A0ABQ5KS59_9EUKA|nr:hypothetical protein ADUPG1_007804 [Aduncisulcus paluster]|eukprot:gnl/Carplike_NY0171/1364_a1852_1072.p2 GENE.gnl/Carplike_NY0171/1364_a1852_1072~~gnl/Carplike_NY0171/1364_a1852_1072.p2  ORF type:complete len:228 (-),score=60.31 gnl/Carplike_NY0171/1364_a1852_1072:339-1022(-)